MRSYNLRLNPVLYAAIRRHAFEREVSMNEMVSDILRLWLVAATDRTDPYFTSGRLGGAFPEPPPERYPGYLEGLVFTIPSEDHVV